MSWPTPWVLSDRYRELHRGASGGTTDPDEDPHLTGASHHGFADHRDYRNASQWAPARGQAASLPPAVQGLVSNDKTHEPSLDGHRDSVLAQHPDGRFAQNTAVTSNHSRNANFEMLTQGPAVTASAATGAIRRQWGLHGGATTTELAAERARRNYEQPKEKPRAKGPEVLVRDAMSLPTRMFSSVLGREWSGSEMMVGAVGLYAVYSAVSV